MNVETEHSPVKTLVTCTDFSDASEAGLAWARAVAKRDHAVTHLIHVVPPISVAVDHVPVLPEGLEIFTEVAEERVQALMAPWEEEGLEVAPHVMVGNPVTRIVKLVERIEPDLVVLSTRGRTGLGRLFLGSTARGVVRRSPSPVLTVHPEHLEPRLDPATVLAPVDFSSHSRRAVNVALDVLPPREGGRLILLHVWHLLAEHEIYGFGSAGREVARADEMKRGLQEKLEEAATTFARSGLEVETSLIEGYPAPLILARAADSGADLLVLGTQGRRGIERWIVGSVAERVVQRAPCPVLTARATDGGTG